MAEQRQLMPSPFPFLSCLAEVLAQDFRIRFMVLLCHHNLGLTTCNLGTFLNCVEGYLLCLHYTVLGPTDKTVFAVSRWVIFLIDYLGEGESRLAS